MLMPQSPQQRLVLRSASGPVWFVVTLVVAVLLAGDLVIRGSLEQAMTATPWLLLVVWFVYAFLWAPRVIATPETVTVHNVLRATTLTWASVSEVTKRWQIEFRLVPALPGKPLQAWGAPSQKPGPRSSTGRRAHASENQLERLRAILGEAREDHPDQPVERTISWDVPGIVAGIVIIVWAVAGLAFSF